MSVNATNKGKLLKVFAALFLVLGILIIAGKAKAADGADNKPTPTPIQDYVNKEQYLNGYYKGTVTSDTATVRPGPGSKAYPELKLADGTVVKLKKGTEVYVWGETKDVDLDVWYHITATFKDQEIEGYIYTGRVKRDNNQILFTPTPTPVPPTPTLVPTITATPEQNETTITVAPTTPEVPKNVEEITKTDKNKPLKIILIICVVILMLVGLYAFFQRRQEKKLEEEMERYSKRRPAMERLDGEDEDDFNEAKKKYYASMEFGRQDGKKKPAEKPAEKPVAAPKSTLGKYSDSFEDDFDENDLKLSTPKKKDDIYDDDEFSDDDVKVMDDFREKGGRKSSVKSVTDSNLDFSDDDIAYFERLKGKVEGPSAKALAAAGTADSILSESPHVNSYFESDETSPEERLRIKLDALRPQDRFNHTLYGEGVVIDNSDPDVIQVRFGRDLRFLKKEKLATKGLVEL